MVSEVVLEDIGKFMKWLEIIRKIRSGSNSSHLSFGVVQNWTKTFNRRVRDAMEKTLH